MNNGNWRNRKWVVVSSWHKHFPECKSMMWKQSQFSGTAGQQVLQRRKNKKQQRTCNVWLSSHSVLYMMWQLYLTDLVVSSAEARWLNVHDALSHVSAEARWLNVHDALCHVSAEARWLNVRDALCHVFAEARWLNVRDAFCHVFVSFSETCLCYESLSSPTKCLKMLPGFLSHPCTIDLAPSVSESSPKENDS